MYNYIRRTNFWSKIFLNENFKNGDFSNFGPWTQSLEYSLSGLDSNRLLLLGDLDKAARATSNSLLGDWDQKYLPN